MPNHLLILLIYNFHPHCFFLLLCFFDWIGDRTTFDVLFYLVILWIYADQDFIPEVLRRVLYYKVSSLLRCGFLLVLWFDITLTQKQRHTSHSRVNRLTHPYKYKLTPPVMCSQQLHVLQWMNNSFISKMNAFHNAFAF